MHLYSYPYSRVVVVVLKTPPTQPTPPCEKVVTSLKEQITKKFKVNEELNKVKYKRIQSLHKSSTSALRLMGYVFLNISKHFNEKINFSQIFVKLICGHYVLYILQNQN